MKNYNRFVTIYNIYFVYKQKVVNKREYIYDDVRKNAKHQYNVL